MEKYTKSPQKGELGNVNNIKFIVCSRHSIGRVKSIEIVDNELIGW